MLKTVKNFDGKGINISHINVLNGPDLVSSIRSLFNEDVWDEIYIHYSGHGQQEGISFEGEIENDDIKNILLDRRVKFCFLSSCFSLALAKLLFESENVPYIIGSKHEMGIQFGIDLTKRFYELTLGDKMRINQAFEKAFSETKAAATEDKDKKATKGLIWAGQLLQDTKLDDITLLAPENGNGHIIYPSLYEEIMNRDNPKRPIILLGYDNNKDIMDEKDSSYSLIQPDYNTVYDIFSLIRLDEEQFNKINDSEVPYKIIFLASSKNSYDFLNDKYPFVLTNNNVPKEQILICSYGSGQTESFQDIQQIKGDFLEAAIYHEDFEKFLLGNTTSNLKSATFNFNCVKQKRKIRNSLRDSDLNIRYFLYVEEDNYHANYLINWLRFENEIITELNIYDDSISPIDENHIDSLTVKCINNPDKHILILRITNLEEIKTIIQKIKEKLSGYAQLFKTANSEILIFVHLSAGKDLDGLISPVNIDTISITSDDFEDWIDNDTTNRIIKSQEVLNCIRDCIDFGEKVPLSKVVKTICDYIKLPHKHVIEIS